MKLPPLLFVLCITTVFSSFTLIAKAADVPLSRRFQYAEVDVKPTPKKPIRVRFPGSVRKKGETAQIVLRFVVTSQGETKKIVVVKFSDPDMIEPAMEAYEAARFNPGMKDGSPVDTVMEVTETYPSK